MRSIITAALMLFCFFSSNSFAHDTGNCAQVESALERLDCYDGQAKLLSSLPTGDEAVKWCRSPAPHLRHLSLLN